MYIWLYCEKTLILQRTPLAAHLVRIVRRSYVARSRGNCVIVHKRASPITTAAFDASNRAVESHVKTNRQNCGRRKVLHETFITSGTGCGYYSVGKLYTRTRVWVICAIVSVNRRCTGGCHRSRANIDFNLGPLHSEVPRNEIECTGFTRSFGYTGVVALVYAQRHDVS